MALLKSAANVDQLQCDGCGRVQEDRGPLLGIREFVVRDPNQAGDVLHHYCVGCASRRGHSDIPRLTIDDWAASPPPTVGPNETHEEHLAAMRGEVDAHTGRGRPVPEDDDARRALERRGFRRADATN